MDRVQHADMPHGRGCQRMLDTDTTYGITSRPSAFGDLRFAGTIAAGLIAGTLGMGALAAPLVGWKDWPSGLRSNSLTVVKLGKPVVTAKPRTTQGANGRPGIRVSTGPGATPLTPLS